MDGKGKSVELFNLSKADRDKGLWVHEPRPVITRHRECVACSQVDLSMSKGRVYLQDVNIGRNMKGVKRGEIKKLMILEVLPKPLSLKSGGFSMKRKLERDG